MAPKAKAISRWYRPLLAALRNVPDRHIVGAIGDAAYEAAARGLLSKQGVDAVITVIVEAETAAMEGK